MERTTFPRQSHTEGTNHQNLIPDSVSPESIRVFSTLLSRTALGRSIGLQSYDGNRNIYQALGYPDNLTYLDYCNRYFRQDMAKAVVDRPAKAVWQGDLIIEESKNDKETSLEKEWKQLEDTLKLKTKFQRADRLCSLGCYSVLLLGLDDVGAPEDFALPVATGKRTLKYLKPYGEDSAQILEYVQDTKDPRYGLPLMYQITSQDKNTGSTTRTPSKSTVSTTVRVHYTRVVHIIDDILENEIIGIPKLEVVFNRLLDLEKLVGGDAEMFWRGARPGYQGALDEKFTMTTDEKDKLKEELDELEHNLRRFLITKGIDIKALAQEIADPTSHVDIQIQMMSAVTGIPKRILTGSERSQLSSTQDKNEWDTYVQNRRDDHAEPHIVRPFVDTLIQYGVLTKPPTGQYTIKWSDLFAMSEEKRVEIGKSRSTALKEYTTNPMAQAIFPPQAFMELCMGLDSDQIDLVGEMVDLEMLTEETSMEKMRADEEEHKRLDAEAKALAEKQLQEGGGNGKPAPGEPIPTKLQKPVKSTV